MKSPILFMLFMATLCVEGATIRILGSDFLPEELKPALSAFAANNNDVLITDFLGSAHAIRTFEDGGANLIIFATPSKNPPRPAYRVYPFAYKAAIIGVNETNPITSLTAEQVASIFGRRSGQSAARWAAFGLDGEWTTRNVQAVTVNSYDFLAVPTLINRIMPNNSLNPGVLTVDTQSAAESILASDPAAIAILDSPPLLSTTKVVSISGLGEGFPFPPTAENINYRDYPAFVAFYLAIPLSTELTAERYAEFLLGDRIAEILTEAGFFPILSTDRENLRSQIRSGSPR
ncbi:MAG: hypothetical protein ACFCU4_02570 [Puniceicoccaceae bacterium]